MLSPKYLTHTRQRCLIHVDVSDNVPLAVFFPGHAQRLGVPFQRAVVGHEVGFLDAADRAEALVERVFHHRAAELRQRASQSGRALVGNDEGARPFGPIGTPGDARFFAHVGKDLRDHVRLARWDQSSRGHDATLFNTEQIGRCIGIELV